MRQGKPLVIVIFLITILFYSCKKEKIDHDAFRCIGCQTVQLSGRVLDLSSNEGMKNVEVKAHFYQWKSNCFICLGKPLETFAKAISDNNGYFRLNIIVDTIAFNYFNHYSLDLNAAINDNYISGDQISFSDYHQNFSNITIPQYKKTKLNITFKRDSSDIFYSYIVRHTFYDVSNGVNVDPTNQIADIFRPYSTTILDTAVETVTGANFWTKIIGKKFSTTTLINQHVDSIFCIPGTTNNITIKY